jgi:hypothetical protein
VAAPAEHLAILEGIVAVLSAFKMMVILSLAVAQLDAAAFAMTAREQERLALGLGRELAPHDGPAPSSAAASSNDRPYRIRL